MKVKTRHSTSGDARWAVSFGRRPWFAAAVALAVAFSLAGCRAAYRGPTMSWCEPAHELPGEPEIRVALLQGVKEVQVLCLGVCDVELGPPRRRVFSTRPGKANVTPVKATAGGFLLNARPYQAEWVLFLPRGDCRVFLNDNLFPGKLRIFRGKAGLTCVNVVPVERYLAGVVSREMFPYWPLAALKAQAVAARSFALSRMDGRKNYEFDLLASKVSQRYEGGEAPAAVRRAVAETWGVTLAHNGKPAPGYSHSCCGGHTVNAADAFGGAQETTTKGVACPFCKNCRRYRWRIEFRADEVASALFGKTAKRRIQKMEAVGARPDGRRTMVRVFTQSGRVDVPVGKFRSSLGGTRVKSELFLVQSTPGGFVLQGRGFGHGVGLCQYGARGMASQGATYRQILAHYFPNLELARHY